VGVVLVGAGFVQAAADEDPADTAGGERDFADGDDVPERQRPQPALVVAAARSVSRAWRGWPLKMALFGVLRSVRCPFR